MIATMLALIIAFGGLLSAAQASDDAAAAAPANPCSDNPCAGNPCADVDESPAEPAPAGPVYDPALPLNEQYTAMRTAFMSGLPEDVKSVIETQQEHLDAKDIPGHALAEGDHAPEFMLGGAGSEALPFSEVLANGPVILQFYRGNWCPYCQMQLQAYAAHCSEFAELGFSIIAVSPETEEQITQTALKFNLPFALVHDEGMELANAFGVAYDVDPALADLMEGFGLDLRTHNGQERAMLPVTATYIIDTDGTIRYAWLGDDYTQRAEPVELLVWARELAGR